MERDAVSVLRAVFEGEELIVHKFPTGYGLASADGVIRRREWRGRNASNWWDRVKSWLQPVELDSAYLREVWVPEGAFLIVKSIPAGMRQRYGLEPEEGAVLARFNASGDGQDSLVQFNNGAQVRLRDLREGQLIEVLSLALVDASLQTLWGAQMR